MKKFLAWLAVFILLAVVTAGATLCVMASVHDHSVKTEFFNWFPALEKTVETEDASKDEDIVIEDETQTEDETVGEETDDQTEGETTGDETSEENTTTEEETQSDETQTEEQTQIE